MEKIYDPIRCIWVDALPEEIVRQALIKSMVQDLGYPKSLLVIEKEISLLPNLKNKIRSTNRRCDIICFANNLFCKESLHPLLMIECKSNVFSDKVLKQVLGYNEIVQAPFIAIANHNKRMTYWFDDQKGAYESVPFLPSYKELINAVKK